MDSVNGVTADRAAPRLCCARCKEPLDSAASELPVICRRCSLPSRITAEGVAYDHTVVLRALYPDRYRLYRVLCNNGFVSYAELRDSSLSLPDRKDVAAFGDFLSARVPDNGWLLDVGCGPLPTPGYLLPLRQKNTRFVGLDVYPTQFAGFRIHGCAEGLPLADAQLDAVVFATSLDHVCDLSQSLREARRVLRAGGSCCIWMSNRTPYWRQYFFAAPTVPGMIQTVLVKMPRQMASNLRHHRRLLYGIFHWFKRSRYWEFDNGAVFYCPPGAIDPFHAWFESPKEILRLAHRVGFTRASVIPSGSNSFVHLAT